MSAYMNIMLDLDIHHSGSLPDGPKILAANHPTSIDPFYLLILVREPVSVLVTAAAFDTPIFGSYLRAAGHIPALRGSGGGTVETLVQQIDSGRTVAIFPEGALSPEGGFHRPHSGLARAALKSSAPVIPVGIGLRHDRIRVTQSEKDGDNVVAHLYHRGPYAMTVGQPLHFSGDPQDRVLVHALSDLVMTHIQDLAHKSQDRIDEAASAPVAQGGPTSALELPIAAR